MIHRSRLYILGTLGEGELRFKVKVSPQTSGIWLGCGDYPASGEAYVVFSCITR